MRSYIGFVKVAETPFSTYQLYVFAKDAVEAHAKALECAPKVIPSAIAYWVHNITLNNGDIK